MDNNWILSPADVQVQTLGLDIEALRKNETRVLDVGCSKEAAFVKYLRSEGVNACGVDPDCDSSESYLIQGALPKGIKEAGNRMPLEDQQYDLVVAHCMPYLYKDIPKLGSTSEQEIRELEDIAKDISRMHVKRSDFAILEMIRVVANHGKVIVYPAISDVKNMEGILNQCGFTFSNEPVTPPPQYSSKHNGAEIKARSVFYKKR